MGGICEMNGKNTIQNQRTYTELQKTFKNNPEYNAQQINSKEEGQ